MFASFLITLREGLEAFLLVGICLSYLAKLGASRHNKFIYLGVGLGLIASLVVAFLFQVVVSQFESERYNHLLMAGILIFATLVLTIFLPLDNTPLLARNKPNVARFLVSTSTEHCLKYTSRASSTLPSIVPSLFKKYPMERFLLPVSDSPT